MKILVIGGMHGNEPLGLAVVKLFEKKPIKGVDTLVANEQALFKNCRFIKNDLNRSFPGNINSLDYETKRANQILKIAKKYDLVLDFHNTMCPGNDCTFFGESANKNLFSISSALNLKRVIVANYDCINKYATNCISVEISVASKRNNPVLWYKKIQKLQKSKNVNQNSKLSLYKFVKRITQDDCERLGLRNKNLKAFKKIPKKLSMGLGVEYPAYPIFIGDGYTPYNYGGILQAFERIEVKRTNLG